MNPNGQEPDLVNPIADQNTERLLAGAYRPETPDPAFIAQVTAAMHTAAIERAEPARPTSRSRSQSAVKRWIGWVAAAGLLLAVGVVAGAMFRGYVDAGAAPKDQVARPEDEPASKDGLKAELQAIVVPPENHDGHQVRTVVVGGSLPQPGATGTVALQGAGAVARPQPAVVAAEVLQVGQSAETLNGQRRRLALADGSTLYLNRDTAITLTARREVTLHRGEIYVEVAQDPAAARFIVNTPRRQMIALGTKFNIRLAPAGTELLVTQGKVQVSNLQLPVLAGQQLMLDGDAAGSPAISAAPRATHTIQWTRDLMADAHSPLVPGSKYSGGTLVAVDPQGQETRLSLRKYCVDVHIEDGFARTTIDQTYFNRESIRLEGTFYFPLPPDASLSRLAMYVNGRLMEGGMAERQHAREVFESIVYRMKDPALLEWVDGSTFKMRVFPLEGRQEKRIILSYTQRLPSLYGQSEYRFPGGHSLPVVGDWAVHVRVKNGAGLECNGEPRFTTTKLAGDLLLDAAAKDIRPDRDVVVRMISNLKSQIAKPGSTSGTTNDPTRPHPLPKGEGTGGHSLPKEEGTSDMPVPKEEGAFSSAVSDGSKYLMLRWRPELPGEKQRQRRDWIFLFESSGDRDPLLARAQVEIVKTILDNAEHDDTFSVLTAATRVHAYQTRPQTATPENVKRAVRFLENVHLVGALDLGRAFDAARPLAEVAGNPVLVHVGSGLPVLGLRDLDALVKYLPQRAAYVGVGVGNRWSRALMKSAAARSGGYFTQINPDEQIAWRALDLLATLNTPRLLGIHVSDESKRVPFLTCEDSLAQGEQLSAIARFDAAAEMPKAVEITGNLGGKPRKWTLSVAGAAEQADYLPRTWAKLEIDRLVADGAEKNKARIIELSKAMYVMSPFTSLLVLENEEMYAQYHVDRGRKDHWAMYACPRQIPVVNEPLVGPPVLAGKAEEKGPAADQVLSTVLVRVPPAILYVRGGMLSCAAGKHVGNDDDGVPDSVWSDNEIRANTASEEQWQKDVQNTIDMARSQVDVDPITAAAMIQNKRSDLTAVSEIRPEVRDRLMRMLHTASLDIKHRKEEFIFREQEQIQQEMARREQEMTNAALAQDQSKVEQLMDRFDSLMAEGRYQLVRESAVSEANKISERSPRSAQGTMIVALPYSRFQGGLDQIMTVRAAAQKGFVDALYQTEKAHVRAVDDPPIVYPDAEMWRELTVRRHEIYGWTGNKVYPGADLVLPIRYPDAQIRRGPMAWRAADPAVSAAPVARPGERPPELGDLSRIMNPVQMEVIEGLDMLVLRGSERDVEQMMAIVRSIEGQAIKEALKQPTEFDFVETPLRDVVDYLKDLHHIEIQLDSTALKEEGIEENTPVTKNLKGISLRSALKLLLDELQLKYVIHNKVLLITTPARAESEELSGYRPDSSEMLRWILSNYNRKVFTYRSPVFSDNPAVFYDLMSYAPAMHTNLADVLAVLDAEAPADAAVASPGKIDDRARRLIERARGTGWQSATIADPHSKTPLTVAFDGTGRYRYERTTSAGLRERVVCDGASLWHLYPELGIGARRTLSRFHRGDFARIVPWALPPAEDLARGADVVSVDQRTVAIVPHRVEVKTENLSETPPSPHQPSVSAQRRAGDEAKSGPSSPIAPHPGPLSIGEGGPGLRTHLVFAPDGRLAERQLVEMPSGRIRVRESYGADGTVEFFGHETKDAGGTPTPQRKILLAPCGAPELKPEADLVVLPMPMRSRQHVLGARKLLANETYGSWSEEDALAVIAADLGEYPAEMKQIVGQRFFRRGDRRLGFYTLLLSTGQTWNPKDKQVFQGGDPLLVDPLVDHPNSPLAKYVAAYLNHVAPPVGNALRGVPNEKWSTPSWNATEGVPYSRDTPTGTGDFSFFRQLAEFHDLWDRWHDGRAMQGDDAQQRQERQRALAFIDRAQSPELAWGLLMAIRAALRDDEFHTGFAAAIQRFETVPGLQYAARYERARDLLGGGYGNQARDLFCKLFTETLETGVVPPIDRSFRDALLQGSDAGKWQVTIRAAARKLIDAGARRSAVCLARQVQQVGDSALAEEIFDMALHGAPQSQRLGLTLARIEHCQQTRQLPRADALLQPLLSEKRYSGSPALWYLAEAIADARGMTARAIGFRQRAMEIELEHLPEKVNVEVIRNDYGQLLSRYEKLATAIGPLHEAGPRELLAEVIRAADQWRQLDTDATASCQAAARILGDLGETDLAWDYLTTPLAVQPNEAAGWADLALALRQQGHVDLADRAYAAAFDAEPTNAQVLWDRAESLWENGCSDKARPLFQQIAAGPWGQQFAGLQSRAKQYVR